MARQLKMEISESESSNHALELRDRLNQIFHQITSERVMSLTSYDFILEALFYAASM